MEAGAGHNRVLYAIVGVIARPTTTFRAISNDPDRYVASSAAIFAAVCLVSALPLTSVWPGSDSGIFNGFDNAVHAYAKSLIHLVLSNFLIIAIVFWVGSRYGGNRKFKNVFPVLSYCLIPVTLGGVVTLAGTHLFVDLVFSYDDMLGTDSPSFALDFAGGSAIPLIHSSFAVLFLAWAFVLFVKATRISHGFGTGKAAGVLALAAVTTYALTIAPGILKGLFLPPAWL